MGRSRKWVFQKSTLEAELHSIEKKELKRAKEAKEARALPVFAQLEEKIPPKVYLGLKKAFGKAFSIVFSRGTTVIEKTFDKDSVKKDFEIRDFAVSIKKSRKEIRKLQKDAKAAGRRNMALSTIEGVGLGLLGIGLPDIVLFVGMILKGVYEISLKYGIDYDIEEEKMFILKLLEASVQTGDEWIRLNDEIDSFIREKEHKIPSDEELKAQIEKTADAFAAEMLIMKFVQGLPLIGALGGVGNPVYYHKIMSYAELKYRKRYLYTLRTV